MNYENKSRIDDAQFAVGIFFLYRAQASGADCIFPFGKIATRTGQKSIWDKIG
jgi:hypothetical protein